VASAFTALIEKLGIAADLKTKLKPTSTGEEVNDLVVTGGADFGVLPLSEILPVRGAELGGMFPSDVQSYIVMLELLVPNAKQNAAARSCSKCSWRDNASDGSKRGYGSITLDAEENFEIGRIRISNPRSENSNWTVNFGFRLSDLKCRIRQFQFRLFRDMAVEDIPADQMAVVAPIRTSDG